jgi:zinc protease
VNFERFKLNNGLIVLFHANGRLPLLTLSAFVSVGKAENPPQRPGLTSMVARLWDEGTENYTHRQLSELVENIGADLTTFSEREFTGIVLQLRSRELELGLRLLADMLIRPTFPADRYERERQRVLHQIRSLQDDPQIVGSQLLDGCVYEGTPLAEPVLGREEALQVLQVEELRSFYGQKVGPRNTYLVVSGDADPSTVIPLIQSLFGSWGQGTDDSGSVWNLKRQTHPLVVRHGMAKEQVNVYLGHLGITRGNPDFYALQVMDVILGGGPGFASRIPRRLRDEQGLVYLCYTDLTSSSGLFPGRFVAYAAASPEKYEKAISGLLSEMESLREEGINGDELRIAQDFLTGSFVFEFQSNFTMARFMLTCEVFSLGRDFPQRYTELIRAVNCEDVRRVARDYLDTVDYSLVLVGTV